MSNTDSRLACAQKAYEAFMRDSVQPLLDEVHADPDKLEFAEISRLIADGSLRRQHMRLAVELLEANIEEYGPLGTDRTPAGARHSPVPVVVSLLAAAAGYAFGGPIGALIAAALGYYLTWRHIERVRRSDQRSTDVHNAEVLSWKRTLKDWRAQIDELHNLD